MWNKTQNVYQDNRHKILRARTLSSFYAGWHSTITSAILLFIGAFFIMNGNFTLGMMSSFQSVLNYMKSSMNKSVQTMNDLSSMRSNIERVDDILTQNSKAEIPIKNTEEIDKVPGVIDIENVTFYYNKGDKPAIDNLTLHIKQGQMIALLGSTGCGKSTLIKLIASLYEPSSGTIKYQVKITDAQMEVSQILFSTLKGIQKIKGFGSARLIYAKWAASYRKMLLHSLNPPIWVKLSGVLSVLIASFGTVLLIGIMVPSKVGLEHYIAFNSSYSLMASAVSELLLVIQSIFLMKPLMNYMKPIFDTKIEQDPEAEYVKHLDGDIELKNIKFSYPGSNNDVLKDVSIKIKKGEKIAIVGKSGCGKSTLLKILMGLESPQSGNVYFDGKPINALNKCSLRKRIGSVFQFGRVMPGTIASNISFTTTDLSDTDLCDAAEKAHIANYIKTLDMGMETEVTQSNVGGFSGGQKQCILLARAFASKPSILILDEATSALDNITQRKVLQSIFNMDASVIMVAHRLSTVKDCDRIVVLKNGRISEEGTYRELMKINGYFAKLVNRQVYE